MKGSIYLFYSSGASTKLEISVTRVKAHLRNIKCTIAHDKKILKNLKILWTFRISRHHDEHSVDS